MPGINKRTFNILLIAVVTIWLLITAVLLVAERVTNSGQSPRRDRIESVGSQLGPFIQKLHSGSFEDQWVFLNNVHVEAGPSKRIVYAVGANGTRMLVVCNSELPKKPTDALFDVEGLLKAPPSARTMRRTWKLSAKDAREIDDQGVYILANNVSLSKR